MLPISLTAALNIIAGSDDEERVSLAERASIEEGARQRAAAVALAGPALQAAIHTELCGVHGPAALPTRQPQQQQQQRQATSSHSTEASRAAIQQEQLRGASPPGKARWPQSPSLCVS